MKVENTAKYSLGAFCNTFDMHLAIIGLKKHVWSSFEWLFNTGFTVHVIGISLYQTDNHSSSSFFSFFLCILARFFCSIVLFLLLKIVSFRGIHVYFFLFIVLVSGFFISMFHVCQCAKSAGFPAKTVSEYDQEIP